METSNPVPEPGESTPVLAALDRYAITRQLSDRAKREYATTFSSLSKFLGRVATVERDFNDETLNAFIDQRVRDRAALTARKDRQQILAVWSWCYRKGLTEKKPRDIPYIRIPHREVRAHKPDHLDALLAVCGNAPSIGAWDSRFDRALILTLYDSGERISALLACPFDALEVEDRVLRIPGWCRKAGHDHVNTMHAQTVDAILATIDEPRERLFPFPLTYLSLLRRFQRLFRAAGVDVKGRKPFHDFRKLSYSLIWDAVGKDAARRHLGHSTDLQRFYLDRSLVKAGRGADVLPRPGRGT